MDTRRELILVPVGDVDRARDFSVEKAGFTLDVDARVSETVRFVQLTPPGSACSIAIDEGIVDTPPGTARLQPVVDDADAAREAFLARDPDVGDVEDLEWGRFVGFADPDGSTWAVQQLPVRV